MTVLLNFHPPSVMRFENGKTETDLLIKNIFIETCTHTKMQVIFMSFKLCFNINSRGKANRQNNHQKSWQNSDLLNSLKSGVFLA